MISSAQSTSLCGDQRQFKYPISVAQYKALKLNPYGYVKVQCGTFEWIKGYIDTVQYSPDKGEADFNLKIKWQQ